MITSLKTLVLKSSILWVLLFCFQAFQAAPCPSDTIIVDGKAVVVERRVSYSEDASDSSGETRKKRILRNYVGGLGMAGGLNQSWQHGRNGFATVNEFIGRRSGQTPLFRAELFFGYESSDSWLIESGIAMSYMAVSERFLTGSALSDSLWAFAISGERLLDQITRERFLTGTEFYRLPVELRDGSYTQLGVELPVQVLRKLNISSRRGQSWYAGAGIRGRYVLNAVSDNWVLLGDSGAYDFIDQQEIRQREFQADAQLLFGTRLDLNPRSYVTVRAFISAPLLGPSSDVSPFEIRWMQAGVSVAINKIFRRDQRLETTNSN